MRWVLRFALALIVALAAVALVAVVRVTTFGTCFGENCVPLATGPKPEPIYCAYLSYGEGELIEDGWSGVKVKNEYETYTMTWPIGFTARRSGEGIEVLSPDGTVWAASGHRYRFLGPSHPVWTGPGCFIEID
jgi:hypothetical protein